MIAETSVDAPLDATPLVTVFTPTYRTGARIQRTYRSLQGQTYDRWEWVVLDDSDDAGITLRALETIARHDARVVVSGPSSHSGKIGAVKRQACALAHGAILVELDHDDELTPSALAEIVQAFRRAPDSGFVYSDCALVDEETGQPLGYGDHWAFGYGSYRTETYHGASLLVTCSPPINAATIRHIVGVPNHVRAWRRDVYWCIGGHDPTLPVADDYDLLVRTFLATAMTHLPALLYVQYLDRAGSAQIVRRQEIQRLVQSLRDRYEPQIHERLLALGLPDPLWVPPQPTGVGAARHDTAAVDRTGRTLSFTCYGVRITVTDSAQAGVCTRLAQLLPPHAQLDPAAQVDADYEVRDDFDGSRMTPRWSILRDGELCWTGTTLDVALHWLRGDIDFQVALRSRAGLFVHAGVVAWRERAIVIPGRSGSGKTRLVEALVRRGAEYFSDEFAVLDEAGRVYPYARVPSRRGANGAVTFALLAPKASVGTQPLPVALLVATTHRVGSAWRPRILTGARAVLPLIDNTVLAQREPAWMLRIAAVLAARVVTLKSDRPEADSVAADILRIMDQLIDDPVHVNERPEMSAELTTADVTYVIPTAVPHDRLGRCLASIRTWSPGSEIIVIANGCTPDPEAVGYADRVIPLERNLRFGAGVNRGVMEASRSLVCVMNDDASFVDDTPARLVAAAAAGKIAGPFSNRAKPPQGDVACDRVPSASLRVPMVVGLCMMMRADLFRMLGGFDTRLDTWEDDDLCLRAGRGGVGCEVVGGTFIEHEGSATFRAQGERVDAIMRRSARVFGRIHARLGVIAIAKDEAGAIEEFYQQFATVTRAWYLLDTGSNDGTIAAARRLGTRVERSAFQDFAHARNGALDAFGGAVDWVVMLDPDERLDAHTIRHLEALAAGETHDIFLAPLRAVSPDGFPRPFVPKAFLFRSSAAIRWTFRVHEKLIGSLRQALVRNATIDHLLALHDRDRRGEAARAYAALQNIEPYFTDPAYRARLRAEWPILDYDRPDDDRLQKISAGPLVSVIIPTYRRPQLLRRAIRSALTQNYPNLEVIVVGDACPDLDTLRCDDPRVRVINLPACHGAGGAIPRNYGLMLAAGEIVAYLDDDNEWLPDHVSSIYEMMQTANAPFGFSSMQVDGRDLCFTEPAYQRIDTSCVLHRKALIDRCGWWKSRDEAGYAHDWEFLQRAIQAAGTWVCTRRPTLSYGAETSGQETFIQRLAQKASLVT